MNEYKRKINQLSKNEMKQRDVYLHKLAKGDIYGPTLGLPSIDKPWLAAYKCEDILKDIDDMSAYQQLWSKNKDNIDYIALNYYDIKITYKTLFRKIDTVAILLKKEGIEAGDIVSICLPNTPEAIYIFYAVNKIGAIANMIDVTLKQEQLLKCIKKTKVLFLFDKLLPVIGDYFSKLDELVKVVAVSAIETLPRYINMIMSLKEKIKINSNKVVRYNEYVKIKVDHEYVETVYNRNIPAVYEHTSGTTGEPKTVILGNETFTGIQHGYENFGFECKEQDVFLNILPPFIAYGLLPSIHFPLCKGFQVVLIPKFEEEKFYEQLIKYKVCHTNATKMHWACVKKHVEDLEFRKRELNEALIIANPSSKRDSYVKEIKKVEKLLAEADFSHLTNCGIGGDLVNIEFEKQMNVFLKKYKCKNPLRKGYGMTEVGSAFTVDPVNYETIEGSVGIPFIANEIMIYDAEENREKRYNERGDLYICGPTMMRGYLDNEEGTKDVMVNIEGKCWIKTGDIAFITEEGALHIVGRKKRMIIVYGGYKVFPINIENIIAQVIGVEDVCVVGVPDQERINIVKAHIVLKSEFKNREKDVIEQVKKLCEEKLVERSIPSIYQVDQKFPKTSNEKIDIRAIEQSDMELAN